MNKKLWIPMFLFFILLLSACSSAMEMSLPTRPPISNLTQESLRQQQLNCLTCSDAEYKQIILDHVGERVRWTNTVFSQEGATTLTLFNHHFSVVLKGVPNETMGKLREGMIITVEGTITRDSQYGWVLTDVVIEQPIEPTPRPTTTPASTDSYNITLEKDTVDVEYDRSDGDYKVSFWIKNNASSLSEKSGSPNKDNLDVNFENDKKIQNC